MVSPVRRAETRDKAEHYRIEPYVVPGDVGTSGQHAGKGGWSWYTGAAAWTWRLAVEGLLGIRQVEGRIRVEPSMPVGWDRFEVTLRRNGATIRLRVENPSWAEGRQAVSLVVDGQPVEGCELSFPPSGETIEAVAILGDQATAETSRV